MHAAQILHAESMARERERAIAELEALKREKDAEKAEAEARWKEEVMKTLL